MKAMKEISRFSGEGNVEDWLDCFETAVSLDHEELCEAELLIMRLEGAAFAIWKGMATDQCRDTGQIKAALRRVYGETKFDAWSQFLSERLVSGELLDVVADRLSVRAAVAMEGDDPKDATCALVLLSILPSMVRDKVKLHLGSCVTLRGVVDTAKLLDMEAPVCPAVCVKDDQ